MTCTDLMSTLSDIAVGASAVVAAFIAWRGLKTWKEQLSGTTEYELARRVLRGVYRLRDATSGVRESFMSIEEMTDPEKAGEMTREQIRYQGVAKAYQTRWDRVTEVHRELQPELLEGEVLWGSDLKARFQVIRKLEHELFVAVRHHVQMLDPDLNERRREAIEKITEKRRDVMFSNPDETPDPFSDEYLMAVREIEDYLRPHLRRS